MLLVRATSEFAALVFDGEAESESRRSWRPRSRLPRFCGFEASWPGPRERRRSCHSGSSGDLFFAASGRASSRSSLSHSACARGGTLRGSDREAPPSTSSVPSRVASLGLLRLLVARYALLVAIDLTRNGSTERGGLSSRSFCDVSGDARRGDPHRPLRDGQNVRCEEPLFEHPGDVARAPARRGALDCGAASPLRGALGLRPRRLV